MSIEKLSRNWNIAGFVIAKLMIALGLYQFFSGDEDWYLIILLGVANSFIFTPSLIKKKKSDS